jgi:hypothetical protein
VLWVKGEAYPLRNISHVGNRRLIVDEGAAWKKFTLRTIGWLIMSGISAALTPIVAAIVFLVGEALLIWRLVSTLQKPPIYGLVMNTSGTQLEAIWSAQQEEIQRLRYEITKAIGNPDAAQAIINVEHEVPSDLVQQFGTGTREGRAQRFR